MCCIPTVQKIMSIMKIIFHSNSLLIQYHLCLVRGAAVLPLYLKYPLCAGFLLFISAYLFDRDPEVGSASRKPNHIR